MSADLLLDTSAVVDVFGRNSDVARLLGSASRLFLPVAALGELYTGCERSRRRAESRAQLAMFTAGVTVLSADRDTAEEFGRLSAALRAKGRPIPANDIWIAATALQHGLPLAARDAHFREIDGLRLVTW